MTWVFIILCALFGVYALFSIFIGGAGGAEWAGKAERDLWWSMVLMTLFGLLAIATW